MSFDLELTGRRALVTAGTKGIGAAVVDVLRNAGAAVVATARAIPFTRVNTTAIVSPPGTIVRL